MGSLEEESDVQWVKWQLGRIVTEYRIRAELFRVKFTVWNLTELQK